MLLKECTFKCTLKILLAKILMTHDISIKELRAELSSVANRAEHGETFRVIRRSKPSFVIMKIDEEEIGQQWETVIDFTEKGTKTGVSLKAAIKALRSVNC